MFAVFDDSYMKVAKRVPCTSPLPELSHFCVYSFSCQNSYRRRLLLCTFILTSFFLSGTSLLEGSDYVVSEESQLQQRHVTRANDSNVMFVKT